MNQNPDSNEELDDATLIGRYLDSKVSKLGYLRRDQILALIEEHGGGGLSEEEVLTLVEENTLSEDEITSLIEANDVSEEEILALIDENTLTTEEVTALIDANTESGLSEEEVVTLIQENTLSEEDVLSLIGEHTISEDRVVELVGENTLSEDRVIELIEEHADSGYGNGDGDGDDDEVVTRTIGPAQPSGDYHTNPGWGLVFETTGDVEFGETVINALTDGSVNVELYEYDGSDTGDLVTSRTFNVSKGENTIDLDITISDPGTYLLTRDQDTQPSNNVSLLRMIGYTGWDDDSSERFNLLNSGHTQYSDNMNWYYFFDLTVREL